MLGIPTDSLMKIVESGHEWSSPRIRPSIFHGELDGM